MKRPRVLYGHPVCKRCWGAFITRRQLAWIIDVFAIQFVAGFLVGLAAGISGRRAEPEGWLVFAVVGVLLSFKDGIVGHSLGKWICGVQVVDRDRGAPSGFGASFLRNLLLIVPVMPIVVALTMNKGPRPGDGIARTRVIWKRYRDHPVFSPPAAAAKVFE